ncbi:MAG: hypothetical protein ABH883_08230 [Candidatus Omnitrophota bacterium]
MRLNHVVFLAAMACFFVTGCAEVEIPSTKDLLKDPLGEGSLHKGMSRTQVINIYGKPDSTNKVVSGDWKNEREEWYYRARYASLPINAGYLSEDLYIYFDDDSLTNVSKTPLGKSVNTPQGKDGTISN